MSDLVSGAKDVFLGDEKKIKQPVTRFSPLQFGTPGLQTQNVPGGFTVSRTPQVFGALGQIGQQSALAGQEIGALKSLVAPGFGKLTESGVQAIQDQRRQAVSNLRENLGRRRVLGSSFGADALARTEAEFGKQEAQFRAEATLQEIQATEKLIADQFELANKGAIATIEQSNFESQIGAELSRQFTSTMSDLAKFESSLLQDAAGAQTALLSSLGSAALGGAFEGGLGKVGGVVAGGIDKAGGFVGGLFGGGGGGAASALGAGGGGLGGAVASEAIGGSLGTIGAGSTGALSGSVSGFGPQALAGPQGASAFGAPAGFGSTSGSGAAAGSAISPATAAAWAGPIQAGVSLLKGEGVGQAASKGIGAAGGAALGAQIGAAGGPVGAAIGGILGGFIGGIGGGKLGEKLGLSARGGGEDKADYSLVTNDSGGIGNLSSEGPWGHVGFGHYKHLTGGGRYKAGLDVITESDKIIAEQLTPEENAKIKDVYKRHKVTSNKNEGGFTPGRMMTHLFNDRANVLQKALGPDRFAQLKLDEIYTALSSGDQQQINAAFT